jgi:acid stress-induced BolA-like protein IbaG/YrbA
MQRQDELEHLRVWLYVSESCVPDAEADRAIEDIVRISREKNRRLSVTGALLFTRHRFAQLIEGPEEGVDALRASILGDSRHKLATTVCSAFRTVRLFKGWSLVYSGASQYMARILNQVELGGEETPRNVRAELALLFQEFAQTEIPEQRTSPRSRPT